MPTYNYQCPCGCIFELMFQPISRKKAPCPECGKDAKRIMSANTFVLSWEQEANRKGVRDE